VTTNLENIGIVLSGGNAGLKLCWELLCPIFSI
jgi:hypothetical protein